MTSDHTSELFPIFAEAGRDFETARHGYERSQVDDYVARTEADLAALAAERDSAAGRSADLAAQLGSAHAQIESVRSRLAESTSQITADNVHSRVRPIVENAQAEARNIREAADAEAIRTRQLADADAFETRRMAAADAERMRQQAQGDLQRATDAAIQREAEADQTLSSAHTAAAARLQQAHTEADALTAKTHADLGELTARTHAELAALFAQTHAELEALSTETTAEVEALTSSAKATRDRLDAEALARRTLANEDFEIALRVRRTKEQAADDARHAQAVATVQQLLSDGHNEAIRVIAEANARVQQLTDLRERMHADLNHINLRVGEVLGHSNELARHHLVASLPGVSGPLTPERETARPALPPPSVAAQSDHSEVDDTAENPIVARPAQAS